MRITASLSIKSSILDVCSDISNTNWSFSSVEPVISNILNLEASSFLYNLKCPTIAFDTVPIVSKNVTRLVPCTSISDTINSVAELGSSLLNPICPVRIGAVDGIAADSKVYSKSIFPFLSKLYKNLFQYFLF